MRRWLLLSILCLHACATNPAVHGAKMPVAWSISKSASTQGRSTIVCELGGSDSCVLERSAPDPPNYTTFALHLWGPKGTQFTGSFFVGFLNDPDPRRYKSEVQLTTDGREIHQRVFGRITTVPGNYSARIRLEETAPGLPAPRVHEMSIPIEVQ